MVIQLTVYEQYGYRCPGCRFELAAEVGDPVEGVNLRCVACDEQLELVNEK